MKPKYFLILLLSLYIVNCTLYIEARATVRFVSKTGTSAPPYTSWQTAADSIQKCINICSFGDTIYVGNGIYKENLVINTAISLIGSSMDSTVIDGRGLNDFTVVLNVSGIIDNFNIFGKGETFLTGRVIRSNNVNNQININNCRLCKSGAGVSMVGGDIMAKNIIIYGVKVGFNLFGINMNTIDDCTIITSNEDSYGIVVGYAPNVINYITNNIILFTGTTNPLSGISVGVPKSIIITNNLISGFSPNVYFDSIFDTSYIYNNLSTYSNSNIGSVFLRSSSMVVENNIFENNKAGLRVYNDPKDEYNLYWKNQTNILDGSLNDSDIVADPMFVKDTIPSENWNLPSGQAGYDFHLQAYSPAIDKGDPSILDVDGSRSDIGLFGGPYGEVYTYMDLAPKPPSNLNAKMDSGLVHLKWNKNTEADLFRYRVYRDTVPDFIYDTTKIIAVISDTSFYDDPPQKFISGNYYYKITAIDNEYHQSAASEEVHINITGIPEAPPIVVEHYNLLQNYPNPFNPSTIIPYRLKSPGYVKIMVYNLLGELVRVLVNKYQSSGYYELLFSPNEIEKKRGEEGFPGMHTWYHSNYVSGVYLYRIEVIGEGNIPVFTDMKKMMIVK